MHAGLRHSIDTADCHDVQPQQAQLLNYSSLASTDPTGWR